MELLPLLIFLGGIVYAAIAGQKDKGKNEERNIDPRKMENPRPSRPRTTQNTGDSSRGFLDTVRGEIERSFGDSAETPERKRQQRPQAQSNTETRQQRPGRQRTERSQTSRTESSRPLAERTFGRDLQEKARDSEIGRRVIDTYEDKVPTDRTKHAERARKAKESVYTEGFDRSKAEKRVAGIGRETAEEVRYKYGDDLYSSSDSRKGADREKDESPLTRDDLTFDRKAVLNGIIFSEILGKPKSRTRSRR